jgi:hypothetical protein
MTNVDSIRKHIQTRPGISESTTIIDNCDLVNIATVEKGLLIVYAGWSGKAIKNFKETIKTLDEFDYDGSILMVDNDIMSADFQIEIFGQLCHGWGEIFIINDGQIVQQFLGRDSFQKFKTYYGKHR